MKGIDCFVSYAGYEDALREHKTSYKGPKVLGKFTYTLHIPLPKKGKSKTLPSSRNSLGCFGVLLEDNGLLPFFEDFDLFAAPETKSSKYQHN